jgi:MFS family permease
MKPTRVLTLVGWAVSAATAGFLFAKFHVAIGAQIPVTPWNLIVTLAAIAVILAVFALPMWRYRRALAQKLKDASAPRPKRLNPFYAVRLLALAKATAISGALFAGWHLGVIWLQLSSPVTSAAVWQNVAGLVAATLMVIVGLLVERICRVPDDSDAQKAEAAKMAGSPSEPSAA